MVLAATRKRWVSTNARAGSGHVEFVVTHPEGYELAPEFVGSARVIYNRAEAFDGADFIYGKDKLIETMENPIDISKRQTKEVLEFKKDKNLQHNRLIS